mgnify:CR=1 FL=1
MQHTFFRFGLFIWLIFSFMSEKAVADEPAAVQDIVFVILAHVRNEEENNNKEILLRPELRIFNQPITITSEADIKTNFIGDKFLVMNLVKGNEYYNIRYQTKPFMIWIWLSAILMGSGALTNFFKRR